MVNPDGAYMDNMTQADAQNYLALFEQGLLQATTGQTGYTYVAKVLKMDLGQAVHLIRCAQDTVKCSSSK